MINKLFSLITTSALCYKAFAYIGRSSFANKTAGISLESWKEAFRISNVASNTAGFSLLSVKEKCSTLFSNIKTSVGNLFGAQTINPAIGAGTSQLCSSQGPLSEKGMSVLLGKRVVVHVAERVSCGKSSAFIDDAIESQIENLEKLLADLIYSDIEKTVESHPFLESATEVIGKLGRDTAKKYIDKIVTKIIYSYEVELDIAADLNKIKILIERTTSKCFNRCDTSVEVLLMNTVNSMHADIEKTWSNIKVVSTLVFEMLNNIHKELQTEIAKLEEVLRNPTIPSSELNDFKNDIMSLLQTSVKSVLSDHITTKIFSPLLECAESYFIQHSLFQKIGKVGKPFFTDEEISLLTKSKRNQLHKKSSNESNEKRKPDFLECDFNRISCELIRSRKNIFLMTYLVSQNAPMDLYCLNLCFKMIFFAFKQEGKRAPFLRVMVKDRDTKHVFCIGDDKSEAPTVSIIAGTDFNSDLKNTKIYVKDIFKFLSKSFQEHYPEHIGLTAATLQRMVLKVINNHCNTHPSNWSSEGWIFKDSAICQRNKINQECENKTPYQHSHEDGNWRFNPQLDVDLREENELISLSRVPCHVLKGFNTALEKVNAHIHMIHERLRRFALVLDDFSATKHQLAHPPPDDTSKIFQCYTVQYELVVPVMLIGCERIVDFAIVLRLENEKSVSKPQPNSPKGPHILYEINPVSEAKFMREGVRGHILLNIDCINVGYAIKDCHVAGELMVTNVQYRNHLKGQQTNSKDLMQKCERGGNMCKKKQKKEQEATKKEQKECDFIIIGDSVVKGIDKHVTLKKCYLGIFQNSNMNRLKCEVMSFLDNYNGIKGVVLFLGNDIIKTNVAEQKLVNCIVDVINEVQEHVQNVKVIIYSLSCVKKPASKHFGKILKTNKILGHRCTKNNLALEDTNKIIGQQDLGRDGIHLKESGYQKLSKHFTEKFKEIQNQTKT